MQQMGQGGFPECQECWVEWAMPTQVQVGIVPHNLVGGDTLAQATRKEKGQKKKGFGTL
jgi:hypothetical protein